ncbi:hypothetical protein HXX76_008675 [Chlamydomonas incerta]|uniref:ATP synthase mitochondrial F1 complex assembly factor 1 n=1 Tax=Chlamydomonas incerta TaxID=51695 RepID=A0A835SWU7_CHLIN|nr:hypothetical protein HXX76_008675 [Chlamydomonas incerta]|eukprot:KAG2432947.1 hypothetical protein HXX76_008675 [Chlamydomonas incerta]
MQRQARLVCGLFRRCPWTAAKWGASLQQEASISGISAPSPTQLGQVVKLDEFIKKDQDEVADIWLGYHADEKGGRVGSVLTSDDYKTFVKRAKESPMFVFAMPKPHKGAGAYETMLIQCQLPYVLITGLEEFKKHGEGAPPYLTLTHYSELLDSHGLALVRGDIIHDKGISRDEARTALELTRAFYCSDEDYALVHTFNHKPASFDFRAVLRKLKLEQ